MKSRGLSAIAALCVLVAGCGLFDSGVPWRGGPYKLSWIDSPDKVSLCYERANGSSAQRIEQCVFAVGWDGRYLVARQHPKGDKAVTNYFIIDASRDSPNADSRAIVVGPLSEAEFMRESTALSLPPFSKELASLK